MAWAMSNTDWAGECTAYQAKAVVEPVL